MFSLLVTSEQCLWFGFLFFTCVVSTSHGSLHAPEVNQGEGKEGGNGTIAQTQREVSLPKQELVSTDQESHGVFTETDSEVTKTEASGRSNFKSIKHLYQTTQYTLHEDKPG